MEPVWMGGSLPGTREPGSLSGAHGEKGEISFGQVMKGALQEVNHQQLEGAQMAEELVLGRGPDLHQVMIALEKADVSFRLATQVRNKLLSAYQEIMRMQV